MITQCCVCHKIRQGDETSKIWVDPPANLDSEELSHGYCPPCAQKAFAELEQWQKANQVCGGKKHG